MVETTPTPSKLAPCRSNLAHVCRNRPKSGRTHPNIGRNCCKSGFGRNQTTLGKNNQRLVETDRALADTGQNQLRFYRNLSARMWAPGALPQVGGENATSRPDKSRYIRHPPHPAHLTRDTIPSFCLSPLLVVQS